MHDETCRRRGISADETSYQGNRCDDQIDIESSVLPSDQQEDRVGNDGRCNRSRQAFCLLLAAHLLCGKPTVDGTGDQ